LEIPVGSIREFVWWQGDSFPYFILDPQEGRAVEKLTLDVNQTEKYSIRVAEREVAVLVPSEIRIFLSLNRVKSDADASSIGALVGKNLTRRPGTEQERFIKELILRKRDLVLELESTLRDPAFGAPARKTRSAHGE
jgi:hypothetical protein